MKTFLSLMTLAIACFPSLVHGEDALDRLKKIQREIDALPIKTKAAKSDVAINDAVITIRASDLEDGVDTVMTQRLRHPAKVIKLIILTPTLEDRLEKLDRDESLEVSIGKELFSTFDGAIKTLPGNDDELLGLIAKATELRESAKKNSNPEYLPEMKKILQAQVEHVERKMKVFERHQHLGLSDRMYRATWLLLLGDVKKDLSSVRFE